MTRSAMRSLLVSIAATALLAGCGSMTAGAAAVVGDRRISVAEVQEATVDAQAWVGEGGQITQTQILYLLAIAPYVQDIAIRYNAGASVDEARKVLLPKVPHPSDAAISVLRANISLNDLQQNLGQEETVKVLSEVNKRLNADGFQVNPRFGAFDSKTGRFLPQQPNWLVNTDAGAIPATPSQ